MFNYFRWATVAMALAWVPLVFPADPPPNQKNMDYKTCTTSGCHTTIKNKRFIHGPVSADGCYLCHLPILGKHAYKLAGSSQTMCITCHDHLHPKNFTHQKGQAVLSADFQKVATHALKKDCLTCHNPHRSNFKPLLADIHKSPSALCYSCHDKKAPSHPMKEDSCFTCHAFHRGQMNTPLLKSEGAVFNCTTCHPETQELPRTKHFFWAGKATKSHSSFACESCHSIHTPPHQIQCTSCHVHTSLPSPVPQIKKVFAHTPILFTAVFDSELHKEIALKLFTADGKRLSDPDMLAHIKCATCHNPHQVMSEDKKQIMIRFCASCHGNQAQKLFTQFHEITGKVKK